MHAKFEVCTALTVLNWSEYRLIDRPALHVHTRTDTSNENTISAIHSIRSLGGDTNKKNKYYDYRC